MDSALLTETKKLLRKDRRSWGTIARETGLTREWVAKFAHDQINDPGVRKIETLHNYLKAADNHAA